MNDMCVTLRDEGNERREDLVSSEMLLQGKNAIQTSRTPKGAEVREPHDVVLFFFVSV